MIACTDTYYAPGVTRTAVVVFQNWPDRAVAQEIVCEQAGDTAEYVPGEFYRRELPGILEAMHDIAGDLDAIIVDGYVWLDDRGRKGLGAHLFEALGSNVPIVGIAKTNFAGNAGIEIFRGTSRHPLIVTAAGIDARIAAKNIESMHGPNRIPTLLKRADTLSRHGTGGGRG